MKTIRLKDGRLLPRLGLGSWRIGEDKDREEEEISTFRLALEKGIRLFDTAEMYGDGKSEILIGKAIEGFPRKDLFLVSKIYPHNCNRAHFFESLQRSLKNLRTDYLDLYLLHWWTEKVDLSEMIELMEEAREKGLIREWGVSNFDTPQMERLLSLKKGEDCFADQCLYHLGSRGVEYDLLPFLAKKEILFMAYSPLAQKGVLKSRLLFDKNVDLVASRHGLSVLELLLAFSLLRPDVVSIPKCGTRQHLLSLLKAEQVRLDQADLALLSRSFPSPTRKTAFDMC